MDRNLHALVQPVADAVSLSARRAWIEIHVPCYFWRFYAVALRKESVDRNGGADCSEYLKVGRSPQGERG